MLKGEYYKNIAMVLTFVTGFINNITGFPDEAQFTEITTIYTDIMLSPIYVTMK